MFHIYTSDAGCLNKQQQHLSNKKKSNVQEDPQSNSSKNVSKGTMRHSQPARKNVSLGASPNNFVGLGSNIFQAAVQKAIII